MIKQKFSVTGMTCLVCSSHVEKSVSFSNCQNFYFEKKVIDKRLFVQVSQKNFFMLNKEKIFAKNTKKVIHNENGLK